MVEVYVLCSVVWVRIFVLLFIGSENFGFGFMICKMGIMIIFILWGCFDY